MKVILADYAGFCFGVTRAMEMVRKVVEESKGVPVYTLGPIIHNPQVVDHLANMGVRAINDLEGVKPGKLVIRSHGVAPDVIVKARSLNFEIVDATCPFVKKAQEHAATLVEEGYQLIILGEAEHPEVIGIAGYAKGKGIIVEPMGSVPPLSQKVGVVCQTTQSTQALEWLVDQLIPDAKELRVFNTICNATHLRQISAIEVAQKVDVMVVVGGYNSANTRRLAQLCKQTGTPTYHIETAEELNRKWFEGVEIVGVSAGASTPEWLIDEVVQKLKSW